MKTSNIKKRGLMHLTSSILLVMLAFMLAITATLAWLSMSVSSTVEGILFEVSAQDNLLIAVKQWKTRELDASKMSARRVEVHLDAESGQYVYTMGDDTKVAIADNIFASFGKKYVFVSEDGREINPQFIISEEEGEYVFVSKDEIINGNLYSSHIPSENGFTLIGSFLEEPSSEDYTNEITEAQLAKVCMNDKNATAITDTLINATTLVDSQNNATSITKLVDMHQNPYPDGKGSRFTTTAYGQTHAYKYEFQLYFMSSVDFSLVLNTRTSSVRSEPNDGRASYDVKAWKNLIIDNYTTDVSLKDYYQTQIGSRDVISQGTKIFAQTKNAIRVGFSDSSDNPIAIWDPHARYGWTKNDPDSNLALEYYNLVSQFAISGRPAEASLTSSTFLFGNMKKDENGKFVASIKVTIWLEGFDADCFDSLMNETLKFSLDFAGQPALG